MKEYIFKSEELRSIRAQVNSTDPVVVYRNYKNLKANTLIDPLDYRHFWHSFSKQFMENTK